MFCVIKVCWKSSCNSFIFKEKRAFYKARFFFLISYVIVFCVTFFFSYVTSLSLRFLSFSFSFLTLFFFKKNTTQSISPSRKLTTKFDIFTVWFCKFSFFVSIFTGCKTFFFCFLFFIWGLPKGRASPGSLLAQPPFVEGVHTLASVPYISLSHVALCILDWL